MDFKLDQVEEDVIVKVTDEETNAEEWFNLKNLINIIIEFINKLIKFEF